MRAEENWFNNFLLPGFSRILETIYLFSSIMDGLFELNQLVIQSMEAVNILSIAFAVKMTVNYEKIVQ